MGALATVGNYKLSVGYRRTVVGHKRALAAPMVGATMINDPTMRDGHTLRERRACQYASVMGARAGSLPYDQSAMLAIWDEKRATVYFMLGARPYAKFEIPSRILEFNPDYDLLCLPEPEPCADTVNMFGDSEPVDADAIEESLDIFLDGINDMWRGNSA